MKVLVGLLVASLAVYSVSSQQDFPKIPGCEKLKDFEKTHIKDCCPSIPMIVDKEIYKTCMDPCKSKDDAVSKISCVTDCVMKNAKVLNETGYVDFELLKNVLNEKAKNDEKWVEVIKTTIETCTTEAPKLLEEWKKRNPPKSETAINMVVKHCVIRNLFFNCPDKKDSQECKDLEEFGKKCPLFPMYGKGKKADEPNEEA